MIMKMRDQEKIKKLHHIIPRWYRKHRRVLQWRTTTDPYEILVSEIMLQQTQVSRVKEKLPLFLKKFPTLSALTKASKVDVIYAWQGMGYNNRAVRVYELARIVQNVYNSKLPRDVEQLLHLPGIGPYTAHAIACFAYRQRVPVVDVNIRRVLSRIFWKLNRIEQLKSEKEIWQLAHHALPRNAYLWNQALMDLGATICNARMPLCTSCPVKRYCSSRNLHNRTHSRAKGGGKAASEPLYKGIPRRIWRGRIVEALRTINGKGPISLPALGKSIKQNFSHNELDWLSEIVRKLEHDGLISTKQQSSTTYVSLAHE